MSSSQRVPPRKEIALASKASNSLESTWLLGQHTVLQGKAQCQPISWSVIANFTIAQGSWATDNCRL